MADAGREIPMLTIGLTTPKAITSVVVVLVVRSVTSMLKTSLPTIPAMGV